MKAINTKCTENIVPWATNISTGPSAKYMWAQKKLQKALEKGVCVIWKQQDTDMEG